jgi:hypothetical protein
MLVDTEHLHYWMQAIRQSPDPMRTMDAFWQGQLKSKEWLVDSLVHVIYPERNKELDFPLSIEIHGGWVGVLASMLFQSGIPIKRITSIDIDPACEPIATMMNKGEEIAGRFQAITGDMCAVSSDADIIINTSCEHISQEQYDLWLHRQPLDSLIVLQSNNYNISEHVRTADSLDQFIEQSHIDVKEAVYLELPLYTRWMIMGNKIITD